MSIQRFETGPRMSQVVVHGNTVYLAGVVANKAKGESVTKQTQEIFRSSRVIWQKPAPTSRSCCRPTSTLPT